MVSLYSWHEKLEEFAQSAFRVQFGWPIDWLLNELAFVFLPWILTAVGFAIRWIARGFHD
jgi:hypothetical protein